MENSSLSPGSVVFGRLCVQQIPVLTYHIQWKFKVMQIILLYVAKEIVYVDRIQRCTQCKHSGRIPYGTFIVISSLCVHGSNGSFFSVCQISNKDFEP
jgi:hypothetical protein